MSLSRAAPLAHAAATALVRSLRDLLVDAASPFDLTLAGLACFTNDAGTQSFLALGAAPACACVRALVRAADDAASLADLPPFHADPVPHASLAWAPGGERCAVVAAAAAVPSPPPLTVRVTRVECRIGKRPHVVWRAEEEGGGGGG